LRTFEVGHGEGRKVLARMNDEQGSRAVETWKANRAHFHRHVDALLAEPFGIERDFRHLLHAACWAFAKVLMQQREWQDPHLGGLLNKYDLNDFTQKDTLGVEPIDTYNNACNGPDGRPVPFQLDRWTTLYLERVG